MSNNLVELLTDYIPSHPLTQPTNTPLNQRMLQGIRLTTNTQASTYLVDPEASPIDANYLVTSIAYPDPSTLNNPIAQEAECIPINQGIWLECEYHQVSLLAPQHVCSFSTKHIHLDLRNLTNPHSLMYNFTIERIRQNISITPVHRHNIHTTVRTHADTHADKIHRARLSPRRSHDATNAPRHIQLIHLSSRRCWNMHP